MLAKSSLFKDVKGDLNSVKGKMEDQNLKIEKMQQSQCEGFEKNPADAPSWVSSHIYGRKEC
eukprot:8037469-Karenia_brevis.AAC.1